MTATNDTLPPPPKLRIKARRLRRGPGIYQAIREALPLVTSIRLGDRERAAVRVLIEYAQNGLASPPGTGRLIEAVEGVAGD